MYKSLFSSLIFTFVLSLNAQYVPNGGFENWEKTVLFEEPLLWNTSNLVSYFANETTTDKTTDSYTGQYALKVTSILIDEDTLFGYAFSKASGMNVSFEETLFEMGGFPITAMPDSFYGYFKYMAVPSDSVNIYIMFKKEGIVISENTYLLGGNLNNYTRLGFNLNDIADIPDTAFIGFASSNPCEPKPGSWLCVDSIWFTGTSDTIPNADFEIWEEVGYSDPVSWSTTNMFIPLTNCDVSATQTSDAHSGSSALRLEGKQIIFQSDENIDTMTLGYLMPFRPLFEDPEYFPLNVRPTELRGYYKYFPVDSDTAQIILELNTNSGYNYPFIEFLTPKNEYSQFKFPLSYPPDSVLSSFQIIALTTNRYSPTEGWFGAEGSTLYLDDLELFYPCDTFPQVAIAEFIPLCDASSMLEVTSYWDTYHWSTGDTTHMTFIEHPGQYSVTVSNIETGCTFSADYEPLWPLCDDIKTNIAAKGSVSFFPNPVVDILNIQTKNMHPGIYTLEIISISGLIIERKELSVSALENDFMIETGNFDPGFYFINLYGIDYTISRKLIID